MHSKSKQHSQLKGDEILLISRTRYTANLCPRPLQAKNPAKLAELCCRTHTHVRLFASGLRAEPHPDGPPKRPIIIFGGDVGEWEEVGKPADAGSGAGSGAGVCVGSCAVTGAGSGAVDKIDKIDTGPEAAFGTQPAANHTAQPTAQAAASHSPQSSSLPSMSALNKGLSMLGRLSGGPDGSHCTKQATPLSGASAAEAAAGEAAAAGAATAAAARGSTTETRGPGTAAGIAGAPVSGTTNSYNVHGVASEQQQQQRRRWQQRQQQMPLPAPDVCVVEGGYCLWQQMLLVASTRPGICSDKIKIGGDAHRLKVVYMSVGMHARTRMLP